MHEKEDEQEHLQEVNNYAYAVIEEEPFELYHSGQS